MGRDGFSRAIEGEATAEVGIKFDLDLSSRHRSHEHPGGKLLILTYSGCKNKKKNE